MKAPGILLAFGASKKGASKDEEAPDSESGEMGGDDEMGESSERTYAREMYSALKGGDEDGFIEAVLALKGCKSGGDDEE